jgi:hypothetical protein
VDRDDVSEVDRFVEEARFWPAPPRDTMGTVINTDAGCAQPAVIPRVTFQDGWFTLPELAAEPVEVKATYRAVFGGTSVSWSETLDVVGSFRLSLPADATSLSALQREWLTGVAVDLEVVLDGGGQTLEVDHAWFVVTDSGVEWFDRARVKAEAPVGAWSAAARATVAEQEREGVWVLPPTGGEG